MMLNTNTARPTEMPYDDWLSDRLRKEAGVDIVRLQFYFRHGTALSEQDNARVLIGSQSVSGYLTRAENCPRCSGQGGSAHWRPDGGVCYQCRGHCTIPVTHRVFTAEKLAKMNETAQRKADKKAEAERVKKIAEHLEFVQWGRPHKIILENIVAATGNSFLADLALKLKASKQLTDRQLEAASNVIEYQKQRDAESRTSEYVGAVKERIEFEAEIIGVYGTEGFYGHTDIVKFKDTNNNQFTWFASDYTNLERGDRISIKGTIKKHDEFRSIRSTVLTRCKYIKFEIMTSDEAAQAETVA